MTYFLGAAIQNETVDVLDISCSTYNKKMSSSNRFIDIFYDIFQVNLDIGFITGFLSWVAISVNNFESKVGRDSSGNPGTKQLKIGFWSIKWACMLMKICLGNSLKWTYSQIQYSKSMINYLV